MGFPEERAKEALKKCGGDVESAVEQLSAQLGSTEEPSAGKLIYSLIDLIYSKFIFLYFKDPVAELIGKQRELPTRGWLRIYQNPNRTTWIPILKLKLFSFKNILVS